MTSRELQIKVAEAMGWVDFWWDDKEGALWGVPLDARSIYRERVPNWPEDIPACMAPKGPGEWLVEQVKPYGGSVDLEITVAPLQSYGEGATGYRCAVYTYPDVFLGEGLGEKGSEAICHAVLAAAARLKGAKQ